jgi:hypothetical protein
MTADQPLPARPRAWLFLGAMLSALTLLFATASSASALTLGVQWTGVSEHLDRELAIIQKSGATMFRIPISPASTAQGANFSQYDSIFLKAAQRGIWILPHFDGPMGGGHAIPSAGEKTQWSEWAKKVVRRYGYKGVFWGEHPEVAARPVRDWEMINEPNNPAMIGYQASGTEYGDFLQWAAPAIQQASESWGGQRTGVVFGGVVGDYKAWMQAAWSVPGASTHLTGVAFHPYALAPPAGTSRIQAFANHMNGLRSFVNGLSGGGSKSLWITEVGWPAEAEFGVGETTQAQLVNESIDWAQANAASLNLSAFIWYNLRDAEAGGWQYRCGLRRRDGSYRPAWAAFQAQAGVPSWPIPTMAFQSNLGQLVSMSPAGGNNWTQGMAPGTSPSITAMAYGGYQMAFQSNNGQLITVGTNESTNWGQGMKPGTSPAIVGLANGGYQIAFQSNLGQLVAVGLAGNTNWGQGMAPGTSPAIAALSNGGYMMAFQANNNQLVTIGTNGSNNWGQGMMPGTSPSITTLSNGGYEIAFQANTGQLISVGSAGGTNWGQGMAAGTSPSITARPDGGYEIAFQANNNQLVSIGTAGGHNWGQGMKPGTSPSISPRIASPIGIEMAFQSNTGQLWSIGTGGGANWGQGMMAGTSPSIALAGSP